MPDTSHELIGNHIYVFKNIKYLFLYNFLSIDIINSVFFIGTLAYLIYRARSYTAAQIKALLIYCVIMANILIFGLINESRVYIEVLPFLIFLICLGDVNSTRPYSLAGRAKQIKGSFQ